MTTNGTSGGESKRQREETDVIFSPKPTYASDVTVVSSDNKHFLLHSQILQMKSNVFCAMETLGKEDKELDLDHPSKELLPFFQTLYSGDYTTLTNENVLIVLKLAHKYDTTQLDAACKIFLEAACKKLEAAGGPAEARQDDLSLLSVTIQLQNHKNLEDLHNQYVDALCRQLKAAPKASTTRTGDRKIAPGTCDNCKNNPNSLPFNSYPTCPWGVATCGSDPFVSQKILLKHLNLSTTLRIIHNLDSNVAKCLKA